MEDIKKAWDNFVESCKHLYDVFLAELEKYITEDDPQPDPQTDKTVVEVDGKKKQLIAKGDALTYVFSVYYADTCNVVSTRNKDVVYCFQSDDFGISLYAVDENGDEVETAFETIDVE